MTVLFFDALSQAAPAKKQSERMERKYYVRPELLDLAYGVLRHTCHIDAEYPAGWIHSVYFDTLDLEQHEKSTSGDARKDKVRIRWYGDDDPLAATRTIFLELKSKDGFAGTKQRLRLDVPAGWLQVPHLARGVVPYPLLRDSLARFGYFPPSFLRPVIRISYWRYRFVEPISKQRVSLDSRIRSSMLRPGFGPLERELELEGGVIEVKGASVELPPTLKRMGILSTDWTRFSKYSASIEAHEERPGAVGRPRAVRQTPAALGDDTTKGAT